MAAQFTFKIECFDKDDENHFLFAEASSLELPPGVYPPRMYIEWNGDKIVFFKQNVRYYEDEVYYVNYAAGQGCSWSARIFND